MGGNNLASDLEAAAARDSWSFNDSSAQLLCQNMNAYAFSGAVPDRCQ